MLRHRTFIHQKEVSIPVTREGPDFKLGVKICNHLIYTSVGFGPGYSCLKQHELCTQEIVVYTDVRYFSRQSRVIQLQYSGRTMPP